VDEEVARRRLDADRDGDDILGMLLGAVGDDGAPLLSDAEIRDQVVTLLAAGFDTTASALGWMLLRVGADAAIWRRLREEAASAFAQGVDADVLARLPYARAVVRETLRVHPPGVFAPRQAARDVELGPHVVPRGSMILWSPYLAGRDPRTWPDPLLFDPERHLAAASSEQAAAMESAWVPFGRGTRKCIGFALAETELTLAAARLAQRVDIALDTTEPPRPYGMVVNRPTGGVRAVVSLAATTEEDR
jgi:cytochrome P450